MAGPPRRAGPGSVLGGCDFESAATGIMIRVTRRLSEELFLAFSKMFFFVSGRKKTFNRRSTPLSLCKGQARLSLSAPRKVRRGLLLPRLLPSAHVPGPVPVARGLILV